MSSPFSAVLLRVCFPSWRFFDDLHWVPLLEFRITERGEGTSWIAGFPPEPRGLLSLFLNARANLRLASQSLVEHFMDEVAELPEGARLESASSYDRVARLVRFRIGETSVARAGEHFEFRVLSAIPGAEDETGREELIRSGVHEV